MAETTPTAAELAAYFASPEYRALPKESRDAAVADLKRLTGANRAAALPPEPRYGCSRQELEAYTSALSPEARSAWFKANRAAFGH